MRRKRGGREREEKEESKHRREKKEGRGKNVREIWGGGMTMYVYGRST